MMFEKILSFILNPESKKTESAFTSQFSPLTLNTALLMIDIASSDQQLADQELELIRSFLAQEFNLSDPDVGCLLDEADRALKQQTDLWEPVHQLNQQMSLSDKKNLLTKLWRIVFADGRLDGNEDHLMHKIADLLKLDHDELIQTKLVAKREN